MQILTQEALLGVDPTKRELYLSDVVFKEVRFIHTYIHTHICVYVRVYIYSGSRLC